MGSILSAPAPVAAPAPVVANKCNYPLLNNLSGNDYSDFRRCGKPEYRFMKCSQHACKHHNVRLNRACPHNNFKLPGTDNCIAVANNNEIIDFVKNFYKVRAFAPIIPLFYSNKCHNDGCSIDNENRCVWFLRLINDSDNLSRALDKAKVFTHCSNCVCKSEDCNCTVNKGKGYCDRHNCIITGCVSKNINNRLPYCVDHYKTQSA